MKRKTKVTIARLQRSGLKLLSKYAGIFLGAVLIAISYNALILPYGLLSGGLAGIALAGNYLMGFPVHFGILILNIPVFLWGLKELQKDFVISSLVSMLIMVVMIPLLRPYIPVPELDIFLASIFSGVVGGLGGGIAFRFGSSFGGTDIISMIMKKKKNISIGGFSFAFNLVVIGVSLFFFPLKIALYTIVSMWVTGKVVNMVIEGFNRYKSVMIITEKSTEIAQRVMKELGRGVTYLEGQGAYSGKPKLVINCVVNHFEIAKIKEIVLNTDPYAFMFFTETVEVSGKGFTIHSKKEAKAKKLSILG